MDSIFSELRFILISYGFFIILSGCGSSDEPKIPANHLFVQDLDLSERVFTDDEFRTLFSESGLYSQITRLNLTDTTFNHALLRFLPPTLVELDLTQTLITHAEIQQYLINLPHLNILNLSWNRLGDEGVRHIARMAGVSTLNLSWNRIGDEGVRHISEMAGVITLNLRGNDIGPEGARHIARMTELLTLDLGSNHIGPEGARYISRMTRVTTLDLSYNYIGIEGARYISEMTGVTTLNLSRNNITLTSETQLRGQMPHARITF